MRVYPAASAFVFAVLAPLSFADAPSWARATSTVTDPAILGAAQAVVRLDDISVVVRSDGVFITEHRLVIEILRNEGSRLATYGESYNAASDKVLNAEAWIVRGGKEVENKRQREWMDLSANANGAIIDETRQLVINLAHRAVKGDLIVFETRVRSKEFIGDRFFDTTPGELPSASAHVRFTLPPGWSETFHTFGPQPPPDHSRTGNVSHWTLPATPFSGEEPYSAPVQSGLIVSIKSDGPQLSTFKDWNDLGGYINRLQAPQCDTSPELQAKVRALTAGCADEAARIAALGRYVQDIRYVGINRNLALGHGYRPRLASEVFKTGYGDCKDKSSLLRSMLREVGVKAHLVAVRVDAGSTIDETVPAPVWFNHAIVAIELPTVPEIWASVVVPAEGKNHLLFDPTDRRTVMGDLPEVIQGTRAFLSQDTGGVLITLPTRDGESGFSIQRRMNIRLAPNGVARCEGTIRSNGQIAAELRAWIESSGTDLDLEKMIRYQISERFRLAVLGEKKYRDDLASGSSQLDFACTVPAFSQAIPGNQAVVKFDLFSHRQTPTFPESVRSKPIQMDAVVIHDEVSLELEKGLEIADLPKSAELQSPYGKYSLRIARKDSSLVVTRRYELFRQVVPAADYAKVKQYLNSIAKADRSAALLRTAAAPAPTL